MIPNQRDLLDHAHFPVKEVNQTFCFWAICNRISNLERQREGEHKELTISLDKKSRPFSRREDAGHASRSVDQSKVKKGAHDFFGPKRVGIITIK